MNKLETVQKNGSLVKTKRFADFSTWPSLFDGLFHNDMPSLMMANFNTGMTLPKVNIRETADTFMVDMAVPRMKKEDFTIDLDNQVLFISTEVSDENQNDGYKYTRREFEYASFKRTFTLPEIIEEEKIKASFSKGILSVHLPKKEEAKQKPPRTITIS
jgi:HSP20 family protein